MTDEDNVVGENGDAIGDDASRREGSTPSPDLPIKKRRGRPPGTGKHPPSESILNTYPFKELIFYEEDKKHKGTGLFYNPEKYKQVTMANFKMLDNGELRWSYRPIKNKYGGKPLLQHDMLLISPSNLVPLAKALMKVAEEWFGGQQKIEVERIEYQEEKKLDNLSDKISKMGW